ncbi:DUF1127 domain-containing protein [Paragemmobacter ruber]|uniref:DUF1127 domain-containing protein n=1 Tax=Paragemmobacter ruber TaxID=1985673 RepID=A0ABW9Y670_9RHOB|nr:DUF1127 domain-containing protein [Rhodobacter ruber]NBE08018.1 DUF1127 domain-containing protein [Rhodobacter ruber]
MKAPTMDRSLATPASRPTRRLRLRERLAQMRALLRQRATLAQLDDHLLRDIGLTRDEAQAEASRPLWDVPANWRR